MAHRHTIMHSSIYMLLCLLLVALHSQVLSLRMHPVSIYTSRRSSDSHHLSQHSQHSKHRLASMSRGISPFTSLQAKAKATASEASSSRRVAQQAQPSEASSARRVAQPAQPSEASSARRVAQPAVITSRTKKREISPTSSSSSTKPIVNQIPIAKKYVLVTGGVISGIGKGVTASSLGVLLKVNYYVIFHVLSHLLLIYICKLHWNLNMMFVCQVTFFLFTCEISIIYY